MLPRCGAPVLGCSGAAVAALAVRGVRAEVLLAERALRPAHRDTREDLGRRQLLAQLAAHGVRHGLLGEVLGGHTRARAHRPDLLARLHCNTSAQASPHRAPTRTHTHTHTRMHTHSPSLADSEVMTMHRNAMPGM